jgi:two-component system sensor histidine kinase TctE
MKHSIRKQLIIRLLILFVLVYCARVLWGSHQALDVSNRCYDEQLLISADSIAARLQANKEGFTADISPSTLIMFTHNNVDSFYYEIFDSGGRRLAGNTRQLASQLDLSLRENARYKTIALDHVPCRIIQARLIAPTRKVIVVAAETENVRTHLSQHILANMAITQATIIIVSAILIIMAINAVFKPIQRLSKTVLNRSVDDLAPLDTKDIPLEVEPLIDAINTLLDRSRNEIEARNRFVANAAHQLRTPIAGLKTYSSMSNTLKSVDDFRRVLDKMDSGVDRITRLVNQLLVLARVEHVSHTIPLDLNAVVLKVGIELNDLAAEKSIELEVLVPPSPATLNVDPSGFRDIAFNLVENAIRYSEPNGKVKVCISSAKHAILLSVEDNGRGIPVDEREHVYERFYRVAGSSGNGCGLGLSIVKEAVLAHKANITISTPVGGHGTLVTVVFPNVTAVTVQTNEKFLELARLSQGSELK